jgi:hypothetical protein
MTLKHLIKKRPCWQINRQGQFYYRIETIIVEQRRRLSECEHFDTRAQAVAAIPEIHADILDALEKGLL